MALGAWRFSARRARHGALDVKELAALLQDTSTPLDLNTMITGEVSEHSYVFYDVAVPTEVKMLKVVIIPSSGAPTSTSPTWRTLLDPSPEPSVGDPDLYLSFDNPFPTGANHTFLSDRFGVEVRIAPRRFHGQPARTDASAHAHARARAAASAPPPPGSLPCAAAPTDRRDEQPPPTAPHSRSLPSGGTTTSSAAPRATRRLARFTSLSSATTRRPRSPSSCTA